MKQNEKYFSDLLKRFKVELADCSEDKFNSHTDFLYKKSTLESSIQAVNNALVEFRKIVEESSGAVEEAAIILHQFCKKLSDQHRVELGKVEQQATEDDKAITERGRLNGLIDTYNQIRVHHDQLTSEHAATAEKRRQQKKK